MKRLSNARFLNTGLQVEDTNASNVLIIKPGSDITADRTLTVTTGDANRLLSMLGDISIVNSLTIPDNFAMTLRQSAASDVTLPTTGTLATLAGSESLSNKTLPTPVITGLPTGSGVASAATASTLMSRDSSGNTNATNVFEGFRTTATAAGTTTLTIADTQTQVFTGATTQTVKLPTTSIPAGALYIIINNSTGLVTVQSSAANSILVLAGGTSAIFTAVVATPTTAANWNAQYIGGVVASGKKLSVSNTMTLAGTDGTTLTMPTSTDTLVGRASTDTLTNKTLTSTTNSVGAAALTNPYKFSVYRNAAFTSPGGAYALITFDTALFDTGSNYSTSTGKFTAPVAGFYWFSAAVNTGVTAPNAYAINLYKNGSSVLIGMNQYSGVSSTQTAIVSGIIQLAATDYIQVFYAGTSGGGSTGAANTYFQGFLVSTT